MYSSKVLVQFIMSKNEPRLAIPQPPFTPSITTNFTIIWSLFTGHKILAWERWCATGLNLTYPMRRRIDKTATTAAATRARFFRFFQLHAPLGVRFTSYIMLSERSRNSTMRRPLTEASPQEPTAVSHTNEPVQEQLFLNQQFLINNNSICCKNLS